MCIIRRRKTLLIVLVCCVISSIFVSGCSFIQEDGEGRHLLKAKAEISILGGPTNTRLVTPETEEILQASKKPSIRQAEVQKALIEKGLGDKVADALMQ